MILSVILKCSVCALLFTVHPHLGYAYLLMLTEALIEAYKKQVRYRKLVKEAEELGAFVITGDDDEKNKDS